MSDFATGMHTDEMTSAYVVVVACVRAWTSTHAFDRRNPPPLLGANTMMNGKAAKAHDLTLPFFVLCEYRPLSSRMGRVKT